MRAVLTRVNSASVAIDGQVVGKIGKGFLILLGVGPDDTEKECPGIWRKKRWDSGFYRRKRQKNLGLDAVGGEVLVVSQFTLYGNCRQGPPPQLYRRREPGTGGAAV